VKVDEFSKVNVWDALLEIVTTAKPVEPLRALPPAA
jgi:hypothetical protein